MAGVKTALRNLARRWKSLDEEIKALNRQIAALVRTTAPELVELHGVGVELAGQFLVTAGDNADRIHTEAAFAKLCGVAPQPASSGRSTGRHRLSRGGDRAANSALYIVAIVRIRHHQPTRDYVQRRTAEGLSKREIIRCLKRYIAREIYQLLTNPAPVPSGVQLRAARTTAGISLATVAEQLGTWPTRISQLERGTTHDAELATRYQRWLRASSAV
jgi:transposase